MKKLEFLDEKPDKRDFGVFETIKVLDGQILRLKLHYQRFNKSVLELKLGELPDIEEFEKRIREENLTGKNFLKITATRNGIFLESGKRKLPKPKAKLCLVSHIIANSDNRYLFHKTTNRDFFNKVLTFAEREGCYDGIIINEKGNITQTSKCNIYFMKKKGLIVTPPLKEGLLPGTIRKILLKRKLVREEVIHISDLKNFKKCFVSNTLIGVTEAEIVNL